MAVKIKVAIIGGGSSYTPEIIEGFIKRHHIFPVSEIYLVDIKDGEHKLNIVGALAKRMIDKAGIACKLYLSLNLDEALKDANFVATQLRVGLLEARGKDERIPLSYGMIGQETNGAGGFMKAQRTIPVILEIAKKMEKLCPDAFLINFTNPASMVTEAVLNNTSIKCIGLCNVPILYQKMVAKLLNAKEDEFLMQMSGSNHYSWIKHVYYKGKDVISTLIEPFLNQSEFDPKNIDTFPFVTEHIKSLNMIPSLYHRYYYLTDEILKKELEEYKDNGTRAEVVKQVEADLFKLYANPNLKEKPKELELRGGAYYSEVACDIMESIYNNKGKMMVVNILNNGTISFLPNNVAIETTCMITSSGALPLGVSDFPESAKAELILMKTYETLAVKASLTGDIGVALQALTINPLVRSGGVMKEMLNDLIKAHIKYLPQYSNYEKTIKKE